MSVQSTQSNAQTLQDELLCPVSLEPLSEAVSLVPCAHKIQKTVAEQMFNQTNGGWQVESRNRCPICRACICGYMVDHSTRNIVNLLFGLPINSINALLQTMKKNLAEKSLVVAKDELVDIPYPGKAARFVHSGGNWNLFDSGADLCRNMTFKSSTKDSLIEEFSLLGYRDGDVMIMIQFSKNSSRIAEYFKKFDMILDWFELQHGYKSKNSDQLKLIFNIIAENNEIPASYFDKIKDIVSKGRH